MFHSSTIYKIMNTVLHVAVIATIITIIIIVIRIESFDCNELPPVCEGVECFTSFTNCLQIYFALLLIFHYTV